MHWLMAQLHALPMRAWMFSGALSFSGCLETGFILSNCLYMSVFSLTVLAPPILPSLSWDLLQPRVTCEEILMLLLLEFKEFAQM